MIGGYFSAPRMSVKDTSVLAVSSTSVASSRSSGGQAKPVSFSVLTLLVEAKGLSTRAGFNASIARVSGRYLIPR
jgi:hypothetical protein